MPFFNAKFPGKFEEQSTKVFWRVGKVTIAMLRFGGILERTYWVRTDHLHFQGFGFLQTEELRNYIFSNGLIRPARLRGQQRAEPTASDWKVLGLEAGTNVADVRRAYKRLALMHHPDKHVGDKDPRRWDKNKSGQKLKFQSEKALNFVGDGGLRKFTKNPRRFSMSD